MYNYTIYKVYIGIGTLEHCIHTFYNVYYIHNVWWETVPLLAGASGGMFYVTFNP